MARKLTHLFVRQIGLVDKGANQEAHLLIAKRDTETTGASVVVKADYTCPECGKQMSSKQELDQHMAQDHADMQKALDEARAELEAVKKELAAAKDTETDPHVETFKENYEAKQKELEDTRRVLKEQLEAATKELEESRAEVQKVNKQRRREKFIKRAQELSDLPGAPADDFAEILDHVESNQVTAKEFEKLNRMLTSWNVIVKKSKLFDEIGHDGVVAFSGPLGQLKAIAAEKRAVDPKLTPEKAFSLATQENPAIYRAYLKDQEGK